MSKLLSPLTIKNITFQNRIVISPMCQYSSEDGFANDWHLVHLGSRAVGGASLIIQEATAVSPEGRITYADMGLWKDEQMDKLKQIVSFIHSQGALAGIQLAHAGRKASHQKPWEGGRQIHSDETNGWQTFAPGAVPFLEGTEAPVELDKQGIKKVIADFIAAAERCVKIGYDVIELHAAHGYLLHQFYSPLSNKRTDEYGGSFENRMRLLVEVTDAVRKVWSDEKPLFVRLSATDWTEGGWTIDDSIKLAALLKEHNVDLIDTSSGGNVAKATIPLRPGYQVEFAEKIKAEANILTGAVGLITNAQQADMILEKDGADLILFARESLRDPYFSLHAAQQLGDDYNYPIQYERAKPK